MCVFGTGEIIPFHGVGLVIWAVIVLLFILGGNYLWRNWKKVNEFLKGLITPWRGKTSKYLKPYGICLDVVIKL